MKKVASIVLNNFKNDSRVLKEATTLSNNGYDLYVVALHENDLAKKETINSIKVERISLTTRKLSKILLVQVIKYLEFAIKVIYKYKNVDIIHCNDLAPLPIAVFMKKFINRKIKIVYDSHEYQTERNGLKGKRKKITEIVERLLIKQINQVITVSEGIAEEYKEKYQIEKPTLIYNCPFYKDNITGNLFREKFNIKEEQIIYLYQGGLFKGRGLEVTLETFKNLDDKNVLVVMGFGELEALVKDYAAKNGNIYFNEAVSPTDLLNYTASADVGLSLIENTSLSYYYSMPNKFFEYSMVGIPVIANNLYEFNRLIDKYENGWLLDELSTDSLGKVINQIEFIKDEQEFVVKKNNSKRLSMEYNWENQENKLLNVYRTL